MFYRILLPLLLVFTTFWHSCLLVGRVAASRRATKQLLTIGTRKWFRLLQLICYFCCLVFIFHCSCSCSCSVGVVRLFRRIARSAVSDLALAETRRRLIFG
jgi:hypothetical protein